METSCTASWNVSSDWTSPSSVTSRSSFERSRYCPPAIGSRELEARPDRRRLRREIAWTRADDVRRVGRVHADGPPRPVGLLVLRRVRDQIAVLDVVGQRVVHFAELLVARRKEEAAAAFDGEMPQQPFAFDGDARDAADADDVDRRACLRARPSTRLRTAPCCFSS